MHLSTSTGREPQVPVAGLAIAHDHFRTGVARLTLTGELDLVTAAQAAMRVRRAQDESRVLICDLAGLWLVDLTGLRVLLDASAYARDTRRRLLKLEHALEVPTLPLRTRQVRACTAIRPHVS